MRSSNPRVLMVSHRHLRPHVSWASAYEFEDVVQEVDDVELLSIDAEQPSPLPLEERVVARLRTHAGVRVSREPRRRRVEVDGGYELFFVRVMTPKELDILESVEGWRDSARVKVCWVEELWVDMLRYTKMLEPLKQFDHVFVGHVPTPVPLSKAIDRPCSFLAPAVDALRFCPYPSPPTRSIDFYALGRRSPLVHEALFGRALQEPGFHYFYDSARWTTFVEDHTQHRELTANLVKRTRYFMADRAKVDELDQTKGGQVFGPRFLEGAAAGAMMIGEPPDCDVFRSYFDWSDAVIPFEYGSAAINDVIDELDAQPERVERARRANVLNTLRRHDWSHRWKAALEKLGFESREPASERSAALEERARIVEAAS